MKEKTKTLLMLCISGILTGLSVSFSRYLGFIEWVSMIPFVAALDRLSRTENFKYRHAYAYGLFYFFSFYAVVFHWFTDLYPLDFTGLSSVESVVVIALAWLGLSLLYSLFGGFVFVAYSAVARSGFAAKFPVTRILSAAAIYTFYEYFSTLGWWAVPWGRLALGQVDILITAESASLFGSYFVTFIIVLVNALLSYAVTGAVNAKKEKIYAITALAIFTVNASLGLTLYFAEKGDGEENTVTVGVIQGNFNSTDKWTASPAEILDKHLSLTASAVENGAETVIWAETALPYVIYDGSSSSDKIAKAAEEHGITILVGAMNVDDGNEYNSIFCFNPDGTVSETIYRKRHLVPFGEYVPMRSLVEAIAPFMGKISMLNDDMTPGDDSEIFDTVSGKIGSLICFDSIYEALCLDSVRDGAELIAISTNDSWFADSAGVYMHNNQARLRAIETGRYVVRSANTGISAVISNKGEVLSLLEPLTEGYLCEEVRLLDSSTLYSVTGNLFVYLCAISILIPFGYDLYFKLRKTQKLQTRLDKYGD